VAWRRRTQGIPFFPLLMSCTCVPLHSNNHATRKYTTQTTRNYTPYTAHNTHNTLTLTIHSTPSHASHTDTQTQHRTKHHTHHTTHTQHSPSQSLLIQSQSCTTPQKMRGDGKRNKSTLFIKLSLVKNIIIYNCCCGLFIF
jgi:hypothetical protein